MSKPDSSLDQGLLSEIQHDLSHLLPASWVLTTLGEPFKWGSGGTPKSSNPDYYGGSIPWLVIGDLTDGFVSESAASITETGLANSSAKLVNAGAILLAMYGSIGKLGIAGRPLATNQAIAFTETGEIDNLYLFYFLLYVRNKLASLGKGATQLNISQTVIKAFPFVLAPKFEQQRIVAKIEELFSELDKGVESLKTAQAQLKVYRQALLKHAFEGKLTAQWRNDNPDKLETADALLKRIQKEREQRYQQQVAEWESADKPGSKPKAPKPLTQITSEELAELPSVPEGWRWFKLADVSDVSGGLTKNQKRDQYPLSRPYLRVANVYANRLELDEVHSIGVSEPELERVTLQTGDLLVVEGNGSLDQIGRVALWQGQIKACVHQNHLIKARPLKGTDPRFVLYFLMSELGRKYIVRAASSTSGLHTLSISKVEGLVVPHCSKDEQLQVIAELEYSLSEAEQLDKTLATALQQSEALRQSILKKAFSGQLVPQDPIDEPASALLARIKAAQSAAPKAKKARK